VRRDSVGRVLDGGVSHGDGCSGGLCGVCESGDGSQQRRSVRFGEIRQGQGWGEAMVVCRTLLTKLTEGAVGDAKR